MDPSLQLDRDGATLFPSFCTPATSRELERILPTDRIDAGVRIFGDVSLSRWLSGKRILDLVRSKMGSRAKAVRAILFDKTADSNWVLGWHQDRTIAVCERLEQPGFDHWTTKSGVCHVEPPFSVIENMLTARIHLDAVTESNSPLLVAPGSHKFGLIKEAQVDAVAEHCGVRACLADAGDVWLYHTAILHSSEKSRSDRRRRVLQVDFSGDELPGGLQWLGIGELPLERAKASS